jgi:hypothetical protein
VSIGAGSANTAASHQKGEHGNPEDLHLANARFAWRAVSLHRTAKRKGHKLNPRF